MIHKKYAILTIAVFVVATSVGLASFFLWKESKKLPQSYAPTPTVAPSITLPAPDVKSWNTYRNEKYGYQISYPAEWTIWNSAGGHKQIVTGYEWALAIETQESVRVVRVYVRKGGEFCEINTADGYIKCDKSSPILSRAEIELSGEKAVLFKTQFSKSCEDHYVRLERYGYVYWIEAPCWRDEGVPNKLFPAILSTFKFTSPPSQDITLEWSVYRNTKYGYEIKYPPNWRIENGDPTVKSDLATNEWRDIFLRARGVQGITLAITVWPEGDSQPLIGSSTPNILSTAEFIPELYPSPATVPIIIDLLWEKGKSWRIIRGNRITISGINTDIQTGTDATRGDGGCWNQFIQVPQGGYIYWFRVHCEQNSNRPLELIPEILSTFKFIKTNE